MVIQFFGFLTALVILAGIVMALLVWKKGMEFTIFFKAGIIIVAASIVLMIVSFLLQILFFVGLPILLIGLIYLGIGSVKRRKLLQSKSND
jgi:membrane protein implicated in regulation of membrane protease activity